MSKFYLIQNEEIHQMEVHKWIESERCQYDLGQEALIEWITKYAELFRNYYESLNYSCLNCGLCDCSHSECFRPFERDRHFNA